MKPAKPTITRYDMLRSGPHSAFFQALDDAFDEPGDFVVEHDMDTVILRTKAGTVLTLVAHAVSYEGCVSREAV